MSTTLDQRVVEMRFDNAQFEKGVKQSINSIDSLKKSLNFDSSTTSVNNLGDTISSAIDKAASKFTSFENLVRGTAIVKVASKIMDVFQNISNMFGKDMMVMGWGKYEQLMSSTQTIMFALRDQWEDQGAEMEFINEQLDKLMWFTDETSYDFADMANNIGKFTSAGVGLEDSVSAMMGISSWAALSGKNAQAASVAMYNLSQALALGYVSAADWKSIELQNMATQEFKQTVIDTAIEMGKLTKSAKTAKGEIVTAENLRSTLKDKWFDNELLLAVLQKFGDFSMQLNEAVSDTGLTATEFRDYIDEFKQAGEELNKEERFEYFKELLGKDGIDNFEDVAEWLSELTDDYYDLGFQAFKAGQECKTFADVINATKDALSTQWMSIYQSLLGNYLQSKGLWSQLAEDLYDILVEPKAELAEMLRSFNTIGGRDKALQALLNIWYNIRDVILQVRSGFNKAFPKATALQWSNIMNDILKATQKLRLVDFPYLNELGQLEDIGKNIGTFANNIRISITRIFSAIGDAWSQIFPKNNGAVRLLDTIQSITGALANLSKQMLITPERADKVRRSFAGVFAALDIVRQLIVAIIKPFTRLNVTTGNLGDTLLDTTASWGDWMVALDEWIAESGIFDTAVETVLDLISKIPQYADEATMALFGMHLDEFGEQIKQGALMALGALLSLVIDIPQNPDDFNIITVWESIKEKMGETWDRVVQFVNDFPQEWDKIKKDLIGDQSWEDWFFDLKQNILIIWDIISKFFGWKQNYDEEGNPIISPFEKLLTNIEYYWGQIQAKVEEIKQKFEPIGNVISELLPEDDAEMAEMIKTGGTLATIAGIAFLIWKAATQIFGIVSLFKDIKGAKKDNSTTGFFKALLKVFGPGGWVSDLAESFNNSIKGINKVLKGGYFVLIGIFIMELIACLAVVTMLWVKYPDETILGFGTFFVTVLIFFGLLFSFLDFVHKLNINVSDMKDLGKGFAYIGFAFVEIAAALWVLKDVDFGQAMGSVLALAILFGVMAGAFMLMSTFKIDPEDAVIMSVAFVAIASSLIVLAIAMNLLKDMDFGQMMAIVAALSIFMLVVVGLGALIGKFSFIGVGLAVLAASFLAFGIAAALFGLGLNLVADAITKLVAVGPDGLVLLHDAAFQLFDDLPVLIPKAGEALRLLCQEFVNSKEDIKAALLALVDIIVDVIDSHSNKILDATYRFTVKLILMLLTLKPLLMILFEESFNLLRDVTVRSLTVIGEILWKFLIETLQQIKDNIGEVVELCVGIASELIQGFLRGIANEGVNIANTAGESLLTFINGLSDAVDKYATPIAEAINKLKEKVLDAFRTAFGIPTSGTRGSTKMRGLGGKLTTGAKQGIEDKAQSLWDSVKDIGYKIITAFQEGMKNAAKFITDGAVAIFGGVAAAVQTKALDEHSPSRVFEEMGENVDLGFAIGLEGYSGEVMEAAMNVAEVAKDKFSDAIKEITSLFEDGSSLDLNPVITPILDDENFKNGLGDLTNELLNFLGIDTNSLTSGFNANLAANNSRSAALSNLADSVKLSDDGTKKNQEVNYNTFNITGDDPKAIANEVSRILQNRAERRGAVWG